MTKEKTNEILFEHDYPEELPEYYVTGANGGMKPPYHFTIDFYMDTIPSEDFEDKMTLQRNGNHHVVSRSLETNRRDMKVRLFMPIQSAKEIADWIYKNLEKLQQQSGQNASQPGGGLYV